MPGQKRVKRGPMLELRTFGGLSIKDDGVAITGAATHRKTLALLALLAAAGKNGLSRDKVMAYLWPERDTDHARALLKQACYALRRDLHTHELFRGATELRLNQDVLASDVQAFEQALQRGDLEAAVRVYAGPFLDGFFIAKAPEFERWVEAERARLKQRACWATETLATAAAARGEHEAAVTWWRHLSALDPLNARIARALMGALAATDDQAGALRHARIHAALLRQELDAAPDPGVTDFARRLREVSEQRARTVAAGEVASESVPHARLREALRTGVVAMQPSRRAFRLARWPAAAAALTAVVGGVLYSHFKKVAALDPDLLAVAPFDVLAPNAELWREGLVDVLSRTLDGAGPLRTVTPTVVIRRWQGRADATSAKGLAGRAGARFVVFGQLLGGGRDSVRVRAAVLDARKDRTLADIDRSEEAGRIDRLADSLSVDVIRALTPATSGVHVRLYSVGTKSLPALKAFLQGERFFRHFSLDSAIAGYDRAVTLDTTFALALRRLQLALGWNDSGPPVPSYYIARAMAFNHGLSPRDSLLLASDSMPTRRQVAVLEAAVRRYPEDPEIWYTLGEVRFHGGFHVGSSWNDARSAFDRAIALDSAFAPAYIHPVEIALNDNNGGAALRYVRGYLAVSSVIPEAAGMRLLSMVLDPQRSASQDFNRELARASRPALYHVALAVQSWPDADETQIQVARRAAATAQARLAGAPADTGDDVRVYLALLPNTLIHRGHLREARSIVENRFGAPFMELAEMGAIPRETVEAVLARWFHHRADRGFSFFPWFADGPCHRTLEAALWWGARRDTASLQRLVSQEESGARAVRNVAVAIDARPVPGFARAALALARGDTSLALSRFLALPDSLCPDAQQLREVRFRLLAATGRDHQAAAVFDGSHDRRVPLMLERARLADRLGDRLTAINYYRFVAQAWLHADPELQPYVAEARAALQRLTGEPAR